jgi:isoleucyl-tRNA synthetase
MPIIVCKPNGRTIWPKFGKDVKFIITEAKSWNFIELENWNVKVWDFELEAEDFELEFEKTNIKELYHTNEFFESGNWTVIAIYVDISEELKLEWIARDIVRHIQEARKEADYQVDDRIKINISWTSEVLNIFKDMIEKETLSSIMEEINSPDLEKELEIEWMLLILKIKK